MLESNDCIISLPDDDQIALCVARTPLLDLEIVDVMKVHIRKQWECHCTLRSALHRLDQSAVFQHIRLQPLLDQVDDPPITNSVFDESYKPLSAQSSRKRDVHSVSFLRCNAYIALI